VTQVLINQSEAVESHEGTSSKSRIKPFHALAEVYPDSLPTGSLSNILDNLEQHVKQVAREKGLALPNTAAFSVTRGLWLELIVSAHAWNYRIERGLPDYFVIKMPNVRAYDFRRIFSEETAIMLDKLEHSLRTHDNQVRLVTSNPDLLVVQQRGLIQEADNIISNLSIANAEKLTGLCNSIRGKCLWNSVKAGIGLKTSLRPDRRLQLVHEGNILKSIFAHLKMRNWDNTVSFEYHGASVDKLSNADDEALQTAATHTIVNVNSVPERAVDGIHPLLEVNDIYKMLDIIIKKRSQK
jgi:hypothetical protein